jgi:hypothetical protein
VTPFRGYCIYYFVDHVVTVYAVAIDLAATETADGAIALIVAASTRACRTRPQTSSHSLPLLSGHRANLAWR